MPIIEIWLFEVPFIAEQITNNHSECRCEFRPE